MAPRSPPHPLLSLRRRRRPLRARLPRCYRPAAPHLPTAGSTAPTGLQPLTFVGVGSGSRVLGHHRRLLQVAVTHLTVSSHRDVQCFRGGGGSVAMPPDSRASPTYHGRGPALASPSSPFKPPRSLVVGSWCGLIGSTPWWLSLSDRSCGFRDAAVLRRTASECAVTSGCCGTVAFSRCFAPLRALRGGQPPDVRDSVADHHQRHLSPQYGGAF
jgi:hypothetical protein